VDPNVTFRVNVDPGLNPMKGPSSAPVTIVEFSEYQCPFCGKAAKTIAQLVKEYPRTVRVFFMNNPLSFHKDAQLAAEAAQAVFKIKGSDAFWKYHDKLFANRTQLKRPNLEAWAKELGVDMKRFKAALDKRTYRKLIKDQQRIVTRLGATGAPAFFINGRFLSGARPLPVFKNKVEEALKRAKAVMKKHKLKPQQVYKHLMKTAKTKAVYKK
jgi:protein-disulfide isomerase